MTLEELNKNYRYKPDSNYDDWRIIKPDKDGLYLGDCESYALTVRTIPEYNHCKIYGNKINGSGHVILVDEASNKWIDCNYRQWHKMGNYPKSYSKPVKLYWVGERFMILKGKIMSLLYKSN